MNLSLRDVVRTRYGIAGGFSVIGNLLSILDKNIDPDTGKTINYKNASGDVSLLLILTPPIPPVISSFTPSSLEVLPKNSNFDITWQVEAPAPWLTQNTLVYISVQDSTSYVKFKAGLSGTENAQLSSTTTFELIAYVTVQGGTSVPVQATVVAQVETPSPSPPPPPPPPPPTLKLFCFKLTNLGSFARPCFTECYTVQDEMTARALAGQNIGYTVELIDPSQATTACS